MATHRRLLVLFTCWWALMLACSRPPLTGASRLPATFKRALLELSSTEPQVIRAELMHRDHPEMLVRLPSGAVTASDATDRFNAHKARIARRLGAGVEFSAPVSSGLPYGQYEYAMTLYLGTPPQKFVVVVDTGSDLVWVQCQPCTSPDLCYNETDPFFNPSASSSYSAVPCSNKITCDPTQYPGGAECDAQNNCYVKYAYGTPGSHIAGVLSTETIAFSNDTAQGEADITNFVFSCMNNDTASFGTFDGLAGFARRENSLPTQLSKLTSYNVFSYCLIPYSLSANSTSPLLFGASDAKGLDLVYTPLLTIPGNPYSTFYAVGMTGFSVNGTAVRIPKSAVEWNSTSQSGGTIFDSGTSDILFLSAIYTPFVKMFKDSFSYPILEADNTTLCYNFGVEQPEIPSVVIHFSGVHGSVVDFPLGFENLFATEIINGTLIGCLAVANVGQSGLNIIGNFAQGDHYVEYDLVNERIGWTSRDCSLPL